MPRLVVSPGLQRIACLLALLLVTGCGPETKQSLPMTGVTSALAPGAEAGVTPAPLPVASAVPETTADPAADVATSPLPTAGAGRSPLPLVVLHTNDNWGETEPCG
jgi:hypothetical protein